MADAPVHVEDYDPSWPARFEAERALLARVLRPWIVGSIEHVGSTAVVGLSAKPIVDIMVGVESLAASVPAQRALEEHGYRYAPYKTDVMHWFCKPSFEQRTHHLHLVPFDGALWHERLAFRDRLRADAALARAYDALKRELARRHRHDREAYTEAKWPFIARALWAPTVREATVDDARELAVTQVEGWRWGYRDILPAAHLASLDPDVRARRWTEILRDARPPQRTSSAWDALGCAGFVSVGAVRGEPAGAGEIYALYVAERAAGRGVARVLMERARADLREAGYRAIVLWVLEANHRARRFYEREGFHADGATKDEVIGGAVVRELRYTSAIEDG